MMRLIDAVVGEVMEHPDYGPVKWNSAGLLYYADGSCLCTITRKMLLELSWRSMGRTSHLARDVLIEEAEKQEKLGCEAVGALLRKLAEGRQ